MEVLLCSTRHTSCMQLLLWLDDGPGHYPKPESENMGKAACQVRRIPRGN